MNTIAAAPLHLAALGGALLALAPAAFAAPPEEVARAQLADPAAPAPPPGAGPLVEVAPEHAAAPGAVPERKGGAEELPDDVKLRGLTEHRLRSAQTSIGGYGEFHLRGTARGEGGDRRFVADVPRLVLFVGHNFRDDLRAYAEIEVEHAFACATCPGAVELEQAFVDWRIGGDALGLRAGLVLVPMGIINLWHEPPIFHGVVRPRVETVIIPSTWRELGAGAFGELDETWRYEIYLHTALDPTGIGPGGLGGGRQNGALARADAAAVTARLEVEPALGFVVGAFGHAADLGSNGDFFLNNGQPVELDLPLYGYGLDARFQRRGLEARALFVQFHFPEAGALMSAFDAERELYFADRASAVPERSFGAYAEVAYDVLRPWLDTSHELLPFVRVERYSTQANVPEGFRPNPTLRVVETTVGLSYRPAQQVVVKADLQLRDRKLGPDESQLNLGVGYLY